MKIIIVFGTRPNFVKVAPLIPLIKKIKKIESSLVHTGQHYDYKMSKQFFNQLQISKPSIFLNVGSSSHANQTAQIMEKFEPICVKIKPDFVMVIGDVNSTLACSLVAAKLKIKIIHLEAGLRNYDRSMPEEINRLITDCLAEYLLTPSLEAGQNLLKEGVKKEKIHFVGNIMIDTLLKYLPLSKKSKILDKLNLKSKQYILITLHRPSNVDDKKNLKLILFNLQKTAKKIKIVFPVHPRTLKNIKKYDLNKLLNNIKIVEPLGYLDFEHLMINSKAVITDSGGIQEETTVLNIPCITIRDKTERPITVTKGTNVVVGLNMKKLNFYIYQILKNKWKKSIIPKFWDGLTSKRILNILLKLK